MTILVSGASGHLGRLILNRLLARGIPASDLVAGARSQRKIADLQEQGIRTVTLDYDDPAMLQVALRGVDKMVLVSVSQPNTPPSQHDAVVEAVASSDVKALAYTSTYRASESGLPLAPIHAAAERAIARTAVPAVILRNNSYNELFLGTIFQARRSGIIASATGDGRIAGATRADYADAAAVAITDDAYLGRTLELSGDTSFSYADIATISTEVLGRAVTHRSLTPEELTAGLIGTGLDGQTVSVLTRLDAAIAAGDLESTDRTLSQMIGRPTTSLRALLRSAI